MFASIPIRSARREVSRAKLAPMAGVAWTTIGLLAATLFGTLYWLGGRMDMLGSRIDALGARLDSRIDSLSARIDSLSARIDPMSARLDTHIENHAG
jgi:hypothetical protein